MAHKRQRKGDGEPMESGATSSDGFLTLFGKESIHSIGGSTSRIARGGFGEVSIALKSCKRPSGELRYSFAAVKTIHNAMDGGGTKNRFGSFGQAPPKTEAKQLSADVASEILALRLLQPHPNIVSLLAVYPDQGGLSLAFDYCPMDLREVLEYRRRTFQQPVAFNLIKSIARDLFEALCHLHGNGILHRDLKPGNLLISQKGVIQFCDFGLARPYDASKETTPTAVNNDKGLCTLYYRPPEVLLGGVAEHPAVDMWSAGLILAELITGRPLLPGRNVLDQLSLVYNHLGTPNPVTWPSVTSLPDYGKLDFGCKNKKPFEEFLPRACESPGLVNLLSNLVVLNPSKRFTAKKALDHDWLPPTCNTKDIRDHLLPASLQIPPLLFSENRQVVEKVGLGIAEARRTLLSTSLEGGSTWQELRKIILR